jgi:hypothetical protein
MKRNETGMETKFESQHKEQTVRREKKEEGWEKEVTTNDREDQQGRATHRIRSRKKKNHHLKNCCEEKLF